MRYFWCSLALMFVLGALSAEGWAKSYSVDDIRITAVVGPDGSMEITENITYTFDGGFSYAFREIPTRADERVSDVVIEAGGRRYTESTDGRPGSFTITRNEGRTKVTWYYTAKNERRTFSLTYTIKGVVRRYPDTAELYFKFVGEGWDRPIGNVSVRVQMPTGVESSDLKAWAHGPLHGVVRILPSGVVSLDVSPLPARAYWEARVLCPAGHFPDVPLATERPRLQQVFAEETAWAEEANRRREAQQRRLEEEIRLARHRAALARKYLPISVLIG
ncbi:MAG: DUF2207 domain-containing protein, partial [Candidatus Latescibacterota bacterium]